MSFVKESKKFYREHPFLAISFGVTAAFITSRMYSATVKPEGEFWEVADGVAGIGHLNKGQKQKLSQIEKELMKASSMHASQADRINQLGMTTSTSTTTSSSHIPAIRDGTAGEPSMPMPVAIMGLPNSIKRRVAQGHDLATDTFYQATHRTESKPIDEVSSMADLMGIGSADMAGHGWM